MTIDISFVYRIGEGPSSKATDAFETTGVSCPGCQQRTVLKDVATAELLCAGCGMEFELRMWEHASTYTSDFQVKRLAALRDALRKNV